MHEYKINKIIYKINILHNIHISHIKYTILYYNVLLLNLPLCSVRLFLDHHILIQRKTT